MSFSFRQYSQQAVNVYIIKYQLVKKTMKKFAMLAAILLLSVACTPTVRVQAPDKPIEINMNINIKHEILIKVEKQVEELLESEDIF